MATHSSILLGKPHGQRSPAGYSPSGRGESGATEHGHMKPHGPVGRQRHFGNLSTS